MTEKLSVEKVEQIIKLAGAPETSIAKAVGISRWTVHHYLEKAGLALPPKLGGGWTKPTAKSENRAGTFAVYYCSSTAKLGYPWVVESADRPRTLAKSIDIIAGMEDFQDRLAWTDFNPRPPNSRERPSYVKGVLMVKGLIRIHNE